MVLKRASHFRDRFAHPRGNLTLSLHSPRLRGSGSERSWPECRWDHSEQASRVCTVDWISLNEGRLKCHCLSIVYVYASSDCGRHEAKIRFYRDSSWSLRSASTTELVVIAGHLNTTFLLTRDRTTDPGPFFCPMQFNQQRRPSSPGLFYY